MKYVPAAVPVKLITPSAPAIGEPEQLVDMVIRSFVAAGLPDPATVTVKDPVEVLNSNQEKEVPTLTPLPVMLPPALSVPRF
jgi:hypothetical protein